MADRVRIFALKRQNVSQKGFNALVHWFPRNALGATRAQIIGVSRAHFKNLRQI
jgi:hypothetical protein